MLLQAGQLLSNIGTQLTSIAYPLLVLALTGSAAKAGFVVFARTIPHALFALPGGRRRGPLGPQVADDRRGRRARRRRQRPRGRRRAGLGCVLADLGHRLRRGGGPAFFIAAYPGLGAVRRPDASAARCRCRRRRAGTRSFSSPARRSAACSSPSRAHCRSSSTSSRTRSRRSRSSVMRAKFQEQREHDHSPLRSQLLEGVRYVWNSPFLRTCL